MSFLLKFLKRHSLKQLATLILEEYVGFLFRYIPSYEGMLLRRMLYKLTFMNIGRNLMIWPNVFITHSYNISAGNYLCINYGAQIDGRGGITIGDYVLVGPTVFIGSSNHDILSNINNPRIFTGHTPSPVKIGSNVWIGANSVICPGVTIGDNSIIAGGSVVTKDVHESILVAGNPAVIKKKL